jgi:type IV pilus assembly protein PilB
MRVRYRVDGILHDALTVPAGVQLEVISHIKIMSEMDISEKRLPQDGHMAVQHEGRDYDLRVSSLPATGGEKIVMRILDKSMAMMELPQLGFTEECLAKYLEDRKAHRT